MSLHYHLIGIGGSGMSAIAHILHDRGEIVSGSDRQENDATARLRASGVKVMIGHAGENVDGADVVIYTAAVPEDNPEMVHARMRGIPLIERPAMLGRIMEPYPHRVAVSGTHGKTTTSSMISVILDRAGMDATILVGGDVRDLGGNARLGGGSIVVTEACEAFESFLHLHPSIAVITNIEADHLDYYGTVERVEESFGRFVSQVDADGCVIANADDPRVRRVLEGCGRRVVWFGLSPSAEEITSPPTPPRIGEGSNLSPGPSPNRGGEHGSPSRFGRGLGGRSDYLAAEIDVSAPEAGYTLVRAGEALGRITLGVPGEQNVVDSLAAAAVAFELGCDFDAVRDGLKGFRGAGRRFEILYDDGEVMVVDDYAHHPTELRATLTGARAAYNKRIIAVFQPHLYSRTRIFADEFADALALADEVILAPIYAAREKPIEGVTSEMIVDRMRRRGFANARYAADRDQLARDLAAQITNGDMVLIIGAGDIREVGEKLAALIREDRD